MAPTSKTILPIEANSMDSERRNAVRYQLTVSAEVVELKSGTRFSTRTTDLGPGGCFVDTLMPLPIGSDVNIRLHKDNISIEATGTVTFSQAGLGMGIAFAEMPPERHMAFEAWLAELTMVRPVSFETHGAAPRVARSKDKAPALTQRLIRLLVKRNLITEAEAAALLEDPLL